MKYERFSELWDALVTNRPKSNSIIPIENGMSKKTVEALIAYGEGDKTQFEHIRQFLAPKSETA